MAHEYPSVFPNTRNIKVLDAHGMAESGSGPRAMGHAIHEGQRLRGGDSLEPGIYLSQLHFADKSMTDRKAAAGRSRGWNVSGTAEGTLYHEFAHVIDSQLRKSPEIRKDLARELRGAGLSVDPDGLSVAYPPGPPAVITGLGRYASENSKGMIAEGFSEWKLDTNHRPIATAIGTVVDRYFKETQ